MSFLSRRDLLKRSAPLMAASLFAAASAPLFGANRAFSSTSGIPDPEVVERIRKAQEEARESKDSAEYWNDEFKTVPLGETAVLTGSKESSVGFHMWEGSMEVTMLDAVLYASLDEARAACELGTILEETPNGVCDPAQGYLVLHVRVRNIDAGPFVEGGEELYAIDFLDLTYFTARGQVAEESGEELPAFAYSTLATQASFDGHPENLPEGSRSFNKLALDRGETKVLTVGYWIPGEGSLMPPADPLRLCIRSYGFLLFELGFGTFEGGLDKDAPLDDEAPVEGDSDASAS